MIGTGDGEQLGEACFYIFNLSKSALISSYDPAFDALKNLFFYISEKFSYSAYF